MTKTQPPLPEIDRDLNSAWPAPAYRERQKRIFEEAAAVLYSDLDYDTVVIDAPTGLGKSVINTGLCRLANSAFYTTPQKSLREQLANDDLLNDHVRALRARDDYMCEHASEPGNPVSCQDCPVNRSQEDSCRNYDGCRYWNAKELAMKSVVAGLTFAYLRIDGFLEVFKEDSEGRNQQVSFGDRELLVIDEAHSIEHQFASMFAGFKLTPEMSTTLTELGVTDILETGIPDSVRETTTAENAPLEDHIVSTDLVDGLYEARDDAMDRYDELEIEYGKLVKASIRRLARLRNTNSEREFREIISENDEEFVDGLQMPSSIQHENLETRELERLPITDLRSQIEDVAEDLQSLVSFMRNIEIGFPEEYNPEEKPWFVEVNTGELTGEEYVFTPSSIDDLLSEHVWSRADKVVLSSATIPSFGGRNRKNGILDWVNSIGLDPESTHVITEDSPFPVENRPIKTDYVAKMSGGGFETHIDLICKKISEIAERHSGTKGLVHVSSYAQARSIGEAASESSDIDLDLTVHERGQDAENALVRWQGGRSESATLEGTQILVSPIMKEGIDLEGNRCRWQVAAKIPYLSLGDPRVRYLQEERGWDWYNAEAATEMVQAAGRGVRNPTDRCDFYVIDSSFRNVWEFAPQWYRAAVTSTT